ncbi:ABC transporter ATP-binding protein [Streptococcus sp. DD13]|uniref:ABC transporter ATP-binding protein n=1 Tax=Streptococcus sp. DD13 TaxID=1777881 RepID=UPI000799FCEB|nr:ABC transporter ATP-binding protein [Streptococcus sp. DD13]KXT78314.1 ABC transporter, ATP-binding/permease protein [Streptococcus sp. DD13]
MIVLKRLLSEIFRHKKVFCLGTLLVILYTVIVQFSSFLLQAIIDGPLTALDQGGSANQVTLLTLAATYFLSLLVGFMLRYWGNVILNRGGNQIAEDLRNRAYMVMQNLPISYFDDKPAGQIATRIVNDTETLRTQFYSTAVGIFLNLARIALVLGILVYLNGLLGLLFLLVLPIFYGIQRLYRSLTDHPMKEFYDARSEVNTQVSETLHGASLIQLYGQEQASLDEFEQITQKMSQADQRIIWADAALSWALVQLLRNLIIAGLITLLGLQFLAGHHIMTAGLLFITLSYLINLFDMLGELGHQLPNFQRSLETGKRVLSLLDQPVEEDADQVMVIQEGHVVFDGVSFAYKDEKLVLKDIHIDAKKGESIALVGHTGSGKSSIVNLLYRFYDPQVGRILVDQQDIRDFSRESLRHQMGIVLQDPYLFKGTIATNVAMTQKGIDRKRVLEALEKVGAQDLLAKLDKGIDEPVFEKGAAFSSGERQLISFARTLYADPKILILDEATSHIDTETEEVIQRAMEVVQEGRTSFVIAHRLSTIQHADQILVLSDGQIVERGRHDDLLRKGGIYAQMSALQRQVSKG